MGIRDRVIPDWVYGSDPSGQLRPDANNALQRNSKPVNIQAQTIAEDAIIPIVYGGPERISGMPYTTCLASNGFDLLVSYILCEGEIESITSVELNNAPLPAGVTVTGYYGTQTQDVDPALAAAITGYAEKHLGTAYIVARFPPGSVTSYPNLTAEIYGKKIVHRGMKGATFAAAPQGYAVLANSAQNSILGAQQIDLTFVGALALWNVAPYYQIFISKWHHPTKIACGLQMTPAGVVQFFYSTTGDTTADGVLTCPLQIPLLPGQFGGIRVVANLAANGFATGAFYSSTDGAVWTQLGATVVTANNLLPAAAFDGAPWFDINGSTACVPNGTLAGLPAYSITDSNVAGYTGRAANSTPIPINAARYHCGFRAKKTVGVAPVLGLNLIFAGGTQKPCYLRMNTTTGAIISAIDFVAATVADRGDHWEFRGTAANNSTNNYFSFALYPAVTNPPGEVGTHTVADLWASKTIADTGAKWQVSSRSEGTENYPVQGIVYSASVKWDGTEHVRFNPEDAADGAVAWNAPTGELWTLIGGATVQPRAAYASTNPAVILDDFMRTYARRLVNLASVKTSAAFCDVPVGTTKRAALTITLAEARDADAWIEVLRGYLPAWVVFKEGEWHIVPDGPSAPVLAYDADADNRTDGESPMQLVKRGTRDVPNVVEVTYTETSAKPWTDKKATATLPGLGTGKRRKTNISFPGIRSYAQAYRFAVERLNHFTLEGIEGDVAVMDDGIRIVPGDIVTITDSAHGWLNQPVRVLRVDEKDNGRWQLRFRIYNAGAYSTDAPAAPLAPSSGTLPNPVVVAPISGLVASESLKYENASINVSDALARGLIWQSRIVASWTTSPDAFFDYYEISLQAPGLAQPSVTTSKLAQFCSAPLIQGTTYTVSVRTINSLGFASAFATVSVTVNGKVNPPGDVTIMEFAAEIGGECILRWKPVPDVDVVRYEWRVLATAAASAPWASMAVIDRPDTNYTRIKGLSPGPTLLAIKAIDSVGRYSTNPFFVNLTITSDASNFLQSFDFTPAADVVRYDWPLVEGSAARPLPRWISVGNVAFSPAGMPNPVSSQSAPVVSGYGRSASAWIVTTQIWDFGLILEATAKINLSWSKVLNSAANAYLVYSLDGSSWSVGAPIAEMNPGTVFGVVSRAITARFVTIQFYAQTGYAAMMQEGPVTVQVSATTRDESGSGNSVASGYTRVNLAQKYTKAVSISITPRGTTFASGSFDNVQVGLAVTPNYFDVYLFNASGVQVASPFSWHFEGV